MNDELHDFIFRTTADGIIITDAHQVIARVNPAAAALLGVRVEELIGRTPQQCFGKNATMLNLFTRAGDQTLDVRLPKRRLAVGNSTSFKDGSQVVLLQDVTEQRDLESRRESLITTVAHDLRNPISALEGYADLMVKFGDLNEQQQRFATRIRQTTRNLYDVVESLVDLAWIEAGMPLAHLPIQLATMIERVVSGLTSLAHSRQITLAVSLQQPMPVVMGDPQRIQLAVHNLVHNAIMYSFAEQIVAIHAWGDDHEAYCTVADQGIGISDEELQLIFDRLYRSRDERVRDIPGGGLGLTLAKKIILRHGGDIWASSNLGEGSTFTFVLPSIGSN
jgi:two-component system sensor histidine kinase ResE